jgi:hypothetical protein
MSKATPERGARVFPGFQKLHRAESTLVVNNDLHILIQRLNGNGKSVSVSRKPRLGSVL